MQHQQRPGGKRIQNVWETVRRWLISGQRNSWDNAELDLSSKAFKKKYESQIEVWGDFEMNTIAADAEMEVSTQDID